MNFLKLVRYPNLLMLALMQFIFRYGFLKMQNIPLALNDFQYLLLVLSTICIAAGGYVINNIYDQGTDLENKPNDIIVGKSISENTANTTYILLNILGVAIGFYLANSIGKPTFASLFIIIAATLYQYAIGWKQIMILGNVIVALLVSFSILIIGVFDLYPLVDPTNKILLGTVFEILIDYAIFAFIINFIREIVKDIEDVNGDSNQGMSTLPIVIGTFKTAKIAFGLSFIPIVSILLYVNNYLFQLRFATIYMLLFVIGPLLYFTIKIWGAKTKKEFHSLSLLLKWVLFFGVLSIAVISLNMKYNA
jgi:4-hydroxybenzoate polyprenyltransferase